MKNTPEIITSVEKKTVLENFFSLTSLQSINYILPLIVLFYLIRVIGPEKYGLIAFAQSFAQYFMILIDYGFSLTATKKISLSRDEEKRTWQIFSSVLSVKIILSALSLFIVILIVKFIPRFSKDTLLHIDKRSLSDRNKPCIWVSISFFRLFNQIHRNRRSIH